MKKTNPLYRNRYSFVVVNRTTLESDDILNLDSGYLCISSRSAVHEERGVGVLTLNAVDANIELVAVLNDLVWVQPTTERQRISDKRACLPRFLQAVIYRSFVVVIELSVQLNYFGYLTKT